VLADQRDTRFISAPCQVRRFEEVVDPVVPSAVGEESKCMSGQGSRQPPNPAVVAELIATSTDLVRCALQAVARAQRVCELSRELVASASGVRIDGSDLSGSTSREPTDVADRRMLRVAAATVGSRRAPAPP
jgi:hypothetical protein